MSFPLALQANDGATARVGFTDVEAENIRPMFARGHDERVGGRDDGAWRGLRDEEQLSQTAWEPRSVRRTLAGFAMCWKSVS